MCICMCVCVGARVYECTYTCIWTRQTCSEMNLQFIHNAIYCLSQIRVLSKRIKGVSFFNTLFLHSIFSLHVIL